MQRSIQRFGLTAIVYCARTAGSAAFSLASLAQSNSDLNRRMSRSMATSPGDECENAIRVLALHGSGERAAEFPTELETLKAALARDFNTKLVIDTVEGPFEKGDGFSWWTMPPGVRSFTAMEYGGFDEAEERVLKVWDSKQPYDLCLGHSQGAIMLSSLIALDKVPYHPCKGYILNGVAFPNPFRQQIKDLRFEDFLATPRILCVMGTGDEITPNETGEELRNSFEAAGINVEMIKHSGGHSIPKTQDEIIKRVAKWIVR